jgi:hypothetical protein
MRRAAWVAAAALAVGRTAPRADEDDPTGDEILDGADVRELLAVLESETFRDPDYAELRGEAAAQFARVVNSGGDALRDAALRRLRDRDGDDLRRAELVLAQIEKLPEEVVRPLLEADDVEVSTWARLALRMPDVGPTPSKSGSEPTFPRDPLLDVHAAVRAAVDGFEFAGARASLPPFEDEKERREVELERATLDLDGDGVAEHCVVAECAGGLLFAAVLRRPEADAAWEIAAIDASDAARHPALSLDDFDGDGRTDFAVRSWSGGTPAHFGLSIYSPKRRSFDSVGWSYHDAVHVVRTGRDRPPVLLVRSPYKDNYGGTSIHLLGVCAMKHDLLRWTPDGVTPVGAAWTKFDVDD